MRAQQATFAIGAILALAGLLASSATPKLVAADESAPEAPIGMVYVPGGTFLMGSDAGKKPTNESPEHKVTLKPYFIGLHEVSNGEYRKFIDAGGYSKEKDWSAAGKKWLAKSERKLPLDWKKLEKKLGKSFDTHPVVGVSWYEADAYARFVGKRLPTEAEWERAARGTDGRLYPWGNDFKAGLRTKKSGEAGVHTYPVESNPADVSPVGAYDMGGNVSEWTSSWFGPYPGTKYKSRYWGKDAVRRLKVARGGSWRFIEYPNRPVAYKSQVTYRLFMYPQEKGYTFIGFRLAADAPK